MASGKVYTGEITLGFATTTEVLDGEVVDKTPLTQPFTADQLDLLFDCIEHQLSHRFRRCFRRSKSTVAGFTNMRAPVKNL